MHNGGVGNFVQLRRYLLQTLQGSAFDFAVTNGSSDTALCFAIFISLIGDTMAPASPEKLRNCLEQTILIIEAAARKIDATEISLLNFVVSDGESLVASRYVISLSEPSVNPASLYYASGNSYESDGSAPGNYAMMHTDRRPSLAIISSEPLTERRADWVSVPRNYSIVITKSMHILLSPISAESHDRISRILGNLSHPRKADFKRLESRRGSTRKLMTPGRHEDDAAQMSTPSSSPYSHPSTVRSVITLPGRSVLSCAILGNFLCSGTDDGTIHIWDMEDNVQSQVLRAGHSAVLSLLADPEDNVLITATSASTVTLYNLTPEKLFKETVTVCCEGMGDILTLTKLKERIFAGFSDASIRCVVNDIHACAEQAALSIDGEKASCPDKISRTTVSLATIGGDFPSKENSVTHNSYIFAVTSCLQDRYLCTGCGDGILRLWNVESEECVQIRDDHAGAILTLATYEVEQGTMLFSGSRDCSVKVWVWDGDSGFICKRTLRKHRDEVIFLGVCGDKLVSGSADGAVNVWCAETLGLICQYKDNSLKAGAASIRFNLLFTASDEGIIQVRDIITTDVCLGKRRVIDGAELQECIKLSSEAERASAKSSEDDMSSTESSSPVSKATQPAKSIKPGTTISDIVSEVGEDSDDVDTLVPGVTNELILAPPMSPLRGKHEEDHKQKLSSLLEQRCGLLDHDSDGILSKENEVTRAAGKKHKPSCTFSPQSLERRLMQDVLARFLSFPTVSGSEEHRESCWQGARYLGTFLEGLGASVKLVSTDVADGVKQGDEVVPTQFSTRDAKALAACSGSNPVILARFESANPNAKTIAFYGHYDVMPADKTQWQSDPWTLTSIDGYLYGRGSTDNKGPIIAMVFAIKQLMEESREGLGMNVVLVFQGEGEMSNTGFKECINTHRHWFEGTSLVLTSNSSWLGEVKPCITYGFRGMIELEVSVAGATRNLHSGVDGGAIFEPMNDLITVLGSIVDSSGVVCVPGFYEDVRPLTHEEKRLLQSVQFDVQGYHNRTGVDRFTTENSAELLESRWRQPSVSITAIETSNISGLISVVPREASAKISVRFVPEQDPAKLERAISTHLEFELKKRRSPNVLTVKCINKGDWWLGDPSCRHFQVAAKAVESVWGVDPDMVCEGGSMPLFSFLEKTLDAPLVQVPLGQSSGGAHLPNERIRAINLFRGKEVFQKIMTDYSGIRQ